MKIKDIELDFILMPKDILRDIKALISDAYIATFNLEENGLVIAFNNNQKFLISCQEIVK